MRSPGNEGDLCIYSDANAGSSYLLIGELVLLLGLVLAVRIEGFDEAK